MSSLYRRSAAAIEEKTGDPDIGGRLERVDVDATGALHLTVEHGGNRRWFRFFEDVLVEVRPQDDRRLPLTKTLRHRKQWQLLAYRPGRRIVVALHTDGTPVVVKGYRRKRSQPAARVHRAAQSLLEGSGFRTARLFEQDPDRESLRLEFLEGSAATLANASLFNTIGAALRHVQEASCDAALPVFGARQELDVLERWRKRVQMVTEQTPPGWLALREQLELFHETLPPPALVACHRDLHDGQFLIGADGPALIDFDLLCRADAALDLANLLAHLTLRDLQHVRGATPARVEACGQALLDGAGRFEDERFHDRLHFYQATTFLRLSLVYGLRAKWTHLSPNLVELAGVQFARLRSVTG